MCLCISAARGISAPRESWIQSSTPEGLWPRQRRWEHPAMHTVDNFERELIRYYVDGLTCLAAMHAHTVCLDGALTGTPPHALLLRTRSGPRTYCFCASAYALGSICMCPGMSLLALRARISSNLSGMQLRSQTMASPLPSSTEPAQC